MAKAWAFLALLFVLVVPLLNEAWDVVSAFKARSKVHNDVDSLSATRPTRIDTKRAPRRHSPSHLTTHHHASSHKRFSDVIAPDNSTLQNGSGAAPDDNFRSDKVVNDSSMEPDLPLETHGRVGQEEPMEETRLPLF